MALHMHELGLHGRRSLRVLKRQDAQRDLFADPQLDYARAVQFYRHDVDWANRMILGDSLQVMASLARREDLAGKVQMIYVDPPYGIRFRLQLPAAARPARRQGPPAGPDPRAGDGQGVPRHLGRWASNSYLAYLRDRLAMARELLTATGSIFVQINDRESSSCTLCYG